MKGRRTTKTIGKKVAKARAAEIIAEELTLQSLRKAHRMAQEQIPRLEKRSDLSLSTLRSPIEAMGGNPLSRLASVPQRAVHDRAPWSCCRPIDPAIPVW